MSQDMQGFLSIILIVVCLCGLGPAMTGAMSLGARLSRARKEKRLAS